VFEAVAGGALIGKPWALTEEPAQLAAVTAAEVVGAAGACVGHESIVVAGPKAQARAALAAVGVK
jgi:hypothetical protein